MKNLATPASIFIFISSSSTGELCSQPIRGNVRRIKRMFPEHVERSFLDPEYSFVAVRRILPTRFAKKSSPNYEPTRFAEYFQLGSRTNIRPINVSSEVLYLQRCLLLHGCATRNCCHLGARSVHAIQACISFLQFYSKKHT